MLAFLLVLLLVSVNLRIVKPRLGGFNYYRMLPMQGVPLIASAHAVSLLPMAIALIMLAAAIRGYCALAVHHACNGLAVRTAQVIAVFYLAKLLTIPTLLLVRKHWMFLGLFFLSMLPLAIAVMFLDEFAWSHCNHRYVWDLFSFLAFAAIAQIVVIIGSR
jgi:hypothetical protein